MASFILFSETISHILVLFSGEVQKERRRCILPFRKWKITRIWIAGIYLFKNTSQKNAGFLSSL